MNINYKFRLIVENFLHLWALLFRRYAFIDVYFRWSVSPN